MRPCRGSISILIAETSASANSIDTGQVVSGGSLEGPVMPITLADEVNNFRRRHHDASPLRDSCRIGRPLVARGDVPPPISAVALIMSGILERTSGQTPTSCRAKCGNGSDVVARPARRTAENAD